MTKIESNAEYPFQEKSREPMENCSYQITFNIENKDMIRDEMTKKLVSILHI